MQKLANILYGFKVNPMFSGGLNFHALHFAFINHMNEFYK